LEQEKAKSLLFKKIFKQVNAVHVIQEPNAKVFAVIEWKKSI